MNSTVYYADLGIRTRSGAYWIAAIMVVAAFQFVVINYMRTNDLVRMTIATFFLVAVMISTGRALRELGRVETQHSTPTDAMKELFRLALTQPIVGCVGLMIGLR